MFSAWNIILEKSSDCWAKKPSFFRAWKTTLWKALTSWPKEQQPAGFFELWPLWSVISSGYTGSLTVEGAVNVSEASFGIQVVTYSLQGLDPQCESATADFLDVDGGWIHEKMVCPIISYYLSDLINHNSVFSISYLIINCLLSLLGYMILLQPNWARNHENPQTRWG